MPTLCCGDQIKCQGLVKASGDVIPGRLIMDVCMKFHGNQGKSLNFFSSVGTNAFDQLTGYGLETRLKCRKQQHRFLISDLYKMFNKFLNWDKKILFLGKQEIEASFTTVLLKIRFGSPKGFLREV